MSHGAEATLAPVLILATSVWTGGFVAIAVVARVARRALGPPERVAFFRALGRTYVVVGGAALAVALGTGAFLVFGVYGHPWDAALVVAVVVAAALVATLAAGVAQARRMTLLRRRALDDPDDTALAARVRRGARDAGVLRASIGVLTIALVVLGAVLAT